MQLGFNLRHDILVASSLLCQQHDLLIVGKGGIDIHRQTDHTQIVLQEILTQRMEGLIGLDTNRISQLPNQLVCFSQGDISDTRHRGRCHRLITILKRRLHLVIAPTSSHILPRGTQTVVQGHIQQLMIGKEHHISRLGNSCQMQLFRIAVHTHLDTASIHPAASIIARTQIFEIADDIVTQVVLQMLGTGRISCLSTRPDAIEEFRTVFQVKAKSLEMIIPVGIFDDDFHLRIHCLRRT